MNYNKIGHDFINTVYRNKDGTIKIVPAPTNFFINSGLYYDSSYNDSNSIKNKDLISIVDNNEVKQIYKIENTKIESKIKNNIKEKQYLKSINITNIRNDITRNDFVNVVTETFNILILDINNKISLIDRHKDSISKSEGILDSIIQIMYSSTAVILYDLTLSNIIHSSVNVNIYRDNLKIFSENILPAILKNINKDKVITVAFDLLNKYINKLVDFAVKPYFSPIIEYIDNFNIDPSSSIIDNILEQLTNSIDRMMGSDSINIEIYNKFKELIKFGIAHNVNYIKLVLYLNYKNNQDLFKNKIMKLIRSENESEVILGSILSSRYNFEERTQNFVKTNIEYDKILTLIYNIIDIFYSIKRDVIYSKNYDKDSSNMFVDLNSDRLMTRLDIVWKDFLLNKKSFDKIINIINILDTNYKNTISISNEGKITKIVIEAEVVLTILIEERNKFVLILEELLVENMIDKIEEKDKSFEWDI